MREAARTLDNVSDHLGEVLRHADALLAEWSKFGAQVRTQVDGVLPEAEQREVDRFAGTIGERGVEAGDLFIEIVRNRIDGDADGEIGCAPERFAGPVGTLIEAAKNFDQSDGIHFVDTAGFGVIAY